jgi:hypothetical protein
LGSLRDPSLRHHPDAIPSSSAVGVPVSIVWATIGVRAHVRTAGRIPMGSEATIDRPEPAMWACMCTDLWTPWSQRYEVAVEVG